MLFSDDVPVVAAVVVDVDVLAVGLVRLALVGLVGLDFVVIVMMVLADLIVVVVLSVMVVEAVLVVVAVVVEEVVLVVVVLVIVVVDGVVATMRLLSSLAAAMHDPSVPSVECMRSPLSHERATRVNFESNDAASPHTALSCQPKSAIFRRSRLHSAFAAATPCAFMILLSA